MTDDEEIVLAFLEESRDNLDQLDRDLVSLETRPADPDLLAQIFRAVHTLKGTCGFLGFPRLERLAHAGEDLLGALRASELVLDSGMTTTLLRLVDTIREVLGTIEQTGYEPDSSHDELVAELRAYLPASSDSAMRTPAEAAHADETPRVERGEPTKPPSAASSADIAGPLDPGSRSQGSASESTVRVDVAVLDRLMNLVGELVLTRNRIGELAAADEDSALAESYRDLRLVAADLQDSVMTARLQSVGIVTGKFHRIARDLAAALGKRIDVEIDGEDVGVDKAVNEALRDPLLHLVRNSVDHGIETPEERVAAGKPAAGRLKIRAFHEGGRVHVEVSDDGRGIDPDGLLRRAVSVGLMSSSDAESATPAQAMDLMFMPGLSTRDEVTSTSGRGVGMDVVRAALEQVGGSIDVTSEPGQGAVFRLNVPLTLAIMPVLIASCADDRYAIPQVHLREIVGLTPEEAAEQVDVVEGAAFLRLRGRLLPLVDLAAQLRQGARRDDGSRLIVVVDTDDRHFGLLVDDVVDVADAVAKPLPRLLRDVPVFTGATILGDGQPALILDIAGLAGLAGIAASAEDLTQDIGEAHQEESSRLLLATARDGGRLAIRIDVVRRLEKFEQDRVEHAGQRDLVQYGDEIVPIARVEDLLPERRLVEREPAVRSSLDGLATVVCETSVGPVGFVVGSIDDVVADPHVPAQPATRAGVEACVVIGDRVAELLDVEALAAAAGIGRRT